MFDWTILHDYLTIATQNNLKMELLWEGVNDDGVPGWVRDAANPVHLEAVMNLS
jgi:hypothetical protein